MSENTEIQKYVESEAFKAMIHNMVKGEFKEILNMITVPFAVITIPMAVLLAYMVIHQFDNNTEANAKLADEIKVLSSSVAKLEGRLN